jgi:hypothetical protein
MSRTPAWQVIARRNGTMADADFFPGSHVLVTCNVCRYAKPYASGRMVMRLRELRMGGTLTTFEEIAQRIEKRCRCGARDWRVDLAFPPHMTSGEIKRLQARARN